MNKYKLVVEDNMGIHTGIMCEKVTSNYDEKTDQLVILGKMRKRDSKLLVNYNMEPEVVCDFFNSEGAVIYTTESKHTGNFWASSHTTFQIIIQDLSKKCCLSELKEIHLYIVFETR